jgi:hypothetical protein
MHALFLVLQLEDEEQALQSLHDDVIPQMRQAPGFNTGTWFGDQRTGHAVVVFDTEEQARQASPPVGTAMPGGAVLSSTVYPITGQA